MGKPFSPVGQLAMAMHAQPGVYALLLGSGASTGAGVPTGWGIVKELVRRVAAADDPGNPSAVNDAAADPEGWWKEHHGAELGYAQLLHALAPTQPARQGLLAEFFRPSDQEREQGIKTPSKAHHAAAALVKRGTVKVIVTTNFDRLMEHALEAAGVAPQVVSRPEAVNGMNPLCHADATVIKLHGDYLDLGTRNTPAELATYPTEWVDLLRQIFDEYGLLVSGWSADWDTALVSALEGAASRRFPLYWDSRSSKGDTAQRLVRNRRGVVIPASSADELFTDLVASLDALERLAQPPLTTAMAVARLKQYLPNSTRRIDLHDLVMGTVDEFEDSTPTPPTSTAAQGVQDAFDSTLQMTAPVLHLLIAGAWHDPDGAHDQLWIDVLQRLIDVRTRPVTHPALYGARRYPALLALSAVGVVAAHRGRESLFLRMATQVEGRRRPDSTVLPAAQVLHPLDVLDGQWINQMPRWDGGIWTFPESHLLKADLRDFFTDYIRSDEGFAEAFHGYEYRLGLIQEQQNSAANGSGTMRAHRGEYVGERAWDMGGKLDVEETFRAQATKRSDFPWFEFLEAPDDVEFARRLEGHHRILQGYRGRH